jgi:hypothetical protein
VIIISGFHCIYTWLHNVEGGTEVEGLREQVLRRMFGPKRDEATGEWRILHSTSLLILTADKISNQE